MRKILIADFYRFEKLGDFSNLKIPILKKCFQQQVKGTILLAEEGINGTIAGSSRGVSSVLAFIRSDPRLAAMCHREAEADSMPFKKIKVRLKKEIITMGVPDLDPTKSVGTYVDPKHWNELISESGVALIDIRNDYEVEIGTFSGAIDPKLSKFRDFPRWLKHNSDYLIGKKIAMFCTGGIRCEKSTALLKKQGYRDVFHLEGGILSYLEVVNEEESTWNGDCFVFDDRVSVKHGLKVGDFGLCHACGRAVARLAMLSNHFIPGVSCEKCYMDYSDEQKTRFSERQKQKTSKTNFNLKFVKKK